MVFYMPLDFKKVRPKQKKDINRYFLKVHVLDDITAQVKGPTYTLLIKNGTQGAKAHAPGRRCSQPKQ